MEELGDLSGRTLVHPQCHFGLDTLSLARAGARATGLDFSDPAVAAARELAARTGIQAEFVQANVYDAVDALGGRRFDVVYTGLGAINWLPDIKAWASTMAALLAPGGTFYLAEFHPFSDVFADDDHTRPDSVFPNNWISTHHDGRIALFPMYSALRRREHAAEHETVPLIEQPLMRNVLADLAIEKTHLGELRFAHDQGRREA